MDAPEIVDGDHRPRLIVSRKVLCTLTGVSSTDFRVFTEIIILVCRTSQFYPTSECFIHDGLGLNFKEIKRLANKLLGSSIF